MWCQFYWRRKPVYQTKSQTCSYTLIHFTESSRYRHDRKSNSQLIRERNCLLFASICVHSRFFTGFVMLIVLVFCVAFIFSLVFVLCLVYRMLPLYLWGVCPWLSLRISLAFIINIWHFIFVFYRQSKLEWSRGINVPCSVGYVQK